MEKEFLEEEVLGEQTLSSLNYIDDMSFVCVQPMNRFIEEGRCLEPPRELIADVLVEHETTIFFGDTGVGKSTFAIQMAIELAEQGRKVLYVNFELSQLQLAQKYPQKSIPPSLWMATIDYSKIDDVTDQSRLLYGIEAQALRHEAQVVMIDNFTNLCINAKEGKDAGNMMLELVRLKTTHRWTMLILAHVPKRKASDPLTLNDLAGSKIISNLADNVVAINKSRLGSDKRYLIQLKYRSFALRLNEKNVQTFTLTMSDGFLHFLPGDFGEEYTHLPRSRDERAEVESDVVRELKQPHPLSYRKIADKLGITLGKVQRVAKEYYKHSKPEKK